MSDLTNYLPFLAVISVFAAASIVYYASRRQMGPFSQSSSTSPTSSKTEPSSSIKTPSTTEAKPTIPKIEANQIKEDLQILTLEKEIVAYALTRLFEAEAEGKITKEHRIELLDKYKAEMKQLEQRINRNETILKLHELEGTQTDLVESFNNRLSQINKEIETLRGILGYNLPVESQQTHPKTTSTPPSAEQSQSNSSKESDSSTAKSSSEPKDENKEIDTPRASSRRNPKTETEQKLEAIQEEVLKALDRLERLEAES